MKLGFVFDVRFTEYMGEYYSTNLTQEFWNRRYLKFFDEVIVIGRYVSVKEDPSNKLVKSSSDKVHFCCMEDSDSFHRILSQKQQYNFIKRNIKDCDRVICRGWWGTSACRDAGIPYMIEVVNCIRDSYWNHSLLGKVVALPNYVLQKKAINNAPYVLYVTDHFLQNRYPTSNKSVGISDVELKDESKEHDKQLLEKRIHRINQKRNTFIIGTAGSVSVRYKGQQYVIRALAALRKQGIYNIEYHLAGSGDKTFLQSVAKKHGVESQIVFDGPIPHNKMFEWYDSLDLYIQPSLTEGLPRAVVEAMSRALPCLGTNAGGIPELLDAKYIYEKKKCPDQEISRLYKQTEENELIKMSIDNFEKSKRFKTELLDQKRQIFFADFCGQVEKDDI